MPRMVADWIEACNTAEEAAHWQEPTSLLSWGLLLCRIPASRPLLPIPPISMAVLDTALHTYCDLLLLAEDPAFGWGPVELRAACQWGHTLQQLAANADGNAAVRERLQVRRERQRCRRRQLQPATLLCDLPTPQTH